MAIIENETKMYYKINFDECAIKGLQVMVNFSIYHSKSDRDKEKMRLEPITRFAEQLRGKAQSLYEKFVGKIEEQNIADVANENGVIDKVRYPELYALQEQSTFYNDFVQFLYENFVVFEDGPSENKPTFDYDAHLQELIEMGFQQVWLEDPILFNSSGTINCGVYQNEPITPEFFYNRLKERMSENIQNC